MAIASKAKEVGGMLLGLAFMVGIFVIGGGLLYGAAELSVWALKWTPTILPIVFWVTVLLLLPLEIFHKSRGLAGLGLFIASYVFGLLLWIWAMAFTYETWGLFAVIAGLFFLGVGVVLIAVIAAIVNGFWSLLGGFAFLIFMTFGTRILGVWLLEKTEQREADLAFAKLKEEQVTPARRIIDQ